MIHGVSEGGGGVDCGKYLAARRFDIRLEPFDLALSCRVRHLLRHTCRQRGIAFGVRAGRSLPPAVQFEAGRFAAGVEGADLSLDVGSRGVELLDLGAVKDLLLLQPADFKLAGVRRFPGACRLAVGFCQLEAKALQRRLEFREPSTRQGLALAGFR
jgi:hypothetical protein